MIVINLTREQKQIENDYGETFFVPSGKHEIPDLTNTDKLPEDVIPVKE